MDIFAANAGFEGGVRGKTFARKDGNNRLLRSNPHYDKSPNEHVEVGKRRRTAYPRGGKSLAMEEDG